MSNEDTYVAQVGGDHYQNDAGYGHWDWVPDIELGYLEGNATKYVDRYKKKGIPLQDLKKAKTYVEKTIAKHLAKGYKNSSILVVKSSLIVKVGIELTQKFSTSCDHDSTQRAFMMTMAGWRNEGDLRVGLGLVDRMLRTVEDGIAGNLGPNPTKGSQAAPTATGAQKTGGSGQAGGAGVPVFASSGSTGVKNDHPAPFGYQDDE